MRIKFRRNKVRLKAVGIVSAVIVFIICIQIWFKNDDSAVELAFYLENMKLLSTGNESECKLPQYDLYDPEIKEYIEKPPVEIECGQPQPYLTYMDRNGYLHLNETEVQINEFSDLKCTLENIVGDKINDYKVIYKNLREIEAFPVLVSEPVVRVMCVNYGTKVYVMVHSQIIQKKKAVLDKNKEIPKNRPSVLIFIIDSMSRGNFIRALPKTYEYLLNSHDMHVFKGLNKVADNTFPNMMALLTGFIGYPRDDMSHIPKWTIKLNSTVKRYDDMPIIWKHFKNSNYITMYAEEYLDATFSYLDVGFRNDPVDYYYRSSYVSLKENLANLNLNKLKFWDRSKWRYCLGNQPSYKYMLNYTEEFLTKMKALKYFALSFFVEMSHEYLNDVKNMDDDLFQFFHRIFSNNLLNNTILIVMGDHGHRFDHIRSTYIGRIEERMPFLGIIAPENLNRAFPNVKIALESHTERLLSWYDIHETLMDVALDNISEEKRVYRPNVIGKSIFHLFNNSRSCTEIGILPEYCMCDKEAQLQTNSSKVIQAANIIVDNINELLNDASSYIKKSNYKCAFIRLKEIFSASVSMRSLSAGSPSLLLRVILEVEPSNALFEAAVEYDPKLPPRVLGDINRINKYGSQSHCIFHDILRLYCYCVSDDIFLHLS